MAEITAKMVQDLRERTGAGMMDSKKALTETGGDIEAAIDYLRKKGLATAAKKASRLANQGLVCIAVDGNKAAVVEVNSETDFVAKNDLFRDFVKELAAQALKGKDAVEKKAAELTGLIAKIGENMNVRRHESIQADVLGAYMHGGSGDGLGKIGVLVALDGGDETLAKQIAMHIAAASPICVDKADVPADVLEREKAIYADQARASGKPEAIIEKMVEGRVAKFFEESVLMEQPFVMDTEKKIKQILPQGVKIVEFKRFALGEGLAKKEDDFAAEVAAMAK